MKTLTTIIVTLAFVAGVEAQQPVHRVKIVKIEAQNQQTPTFQVSGPREKATKPRNWIEIEAEVEVETKDTSGFIPELEAQWFAIIKDKDTGKPVRILGKTIFKNINTADKKAFLSAYIDPDTLERITGGARPDKGDIEGFAMTISGDRIITEGRHAAGLTMATTKEETKWWEIWKYQSLDGLIVPKSKTPFASLWTDRYPTEKSPIE